MASIGAIAGLLFVVALHTVIAAVATRFFRISLDTVWGSAVYAVVFVPMLLVASTLVLTGALGIGGNVGNKTTAVLLVIAIPLTLGFAIDLLWMPDPETVELPEKT
ncbi:hypothetical protein [Natronoarchaeum rubrum]|uniref:hypothetical protein n=1 Tax=Natronoarchaeum rubrum TaxID=755311 RepID=UPI00211304FE|nr:hypothetical protein [Natronoarchaeum rubrum]